MKALLSKGKLILVPTTEDEKLTLAEWKQHHTGHVLYAQANRGAGLSLFDLGVREDACREPIQISSKVRDESLRLISNFAHTPFVFDGLNCASVEGFWQGLKFEDETERRRIAALWGKEAMLAGKKQPYGATVTYKGEPVAVGTWAHWKLMEGACLAKFRQHALAREALLNTGTRPLVHRMRKDSKSIPGVIMAGIWMKIRDRLRAAIEVAP